VYGILYSRASLFRGWHKNQSWEGIGFGFGSTVRVSLFSLNQPAGPLVDPLGKIVNIEQIPKNGHME